MKFDVIDDFVADAKNVGVSIAAGKSAETAKTKATSMAQFPSNRSNGYDNVADDFRVSELYKNGLLFTAYDYKSRTTVDLRTMRSAMQKKITGSTTNLVNSLMSIRRGTPSNLSTDMDILKNPVANILMPRSKSDVDNTSHRFNDVGDSLISRGQGTATGVLSNIASTSVFGAIEAITQGAMSDHGEQIYNTARSMYAGPDNRTKIFTWDLTPRTVEDLTEILRIYELFNYYSYGITGTSQFAKEIKDSIDDWYKKTFINPMSAEGADTSNTLMEGITSFLTNVIVVSNPTVWFIRNFGNNTSFDKYKDVFGPCQIQNIRFDKSPDGNANGLAIAPNLPSSFVLEITFREILTLNRDSVYGREII